jgi:hypothetical protein
MAANTQPPCVYDIHASWQDNLSRGPVASSCSGATLERMLPPRDQWVDFLGHQVASRIGVPAGPLLDSKWVAFAGGLGYDVVTYKTIRTQPSAGHAPPNVLRLATQQQLAPKDDGVPLQVCVCVCLEGAGRWLLRHACMRDRARHAMHVCPFPSPGGGRTFTSSCGDHQQLRHAQHGRAVPAAGHPRRCRGAGARPGALLCVAVRRCWRAWAHTQACSLLCIPSLLPCAPPCTLLPPQLLVVSVTGTPQRDGSAASFTRDFADAAVLAQRAGARVRACWVRARAVCACGLQHRIPAHTCLRMLLHMLS